MRTWTTLLLALLLTALAPNAKAWAGTDRLKVIDFEDEVVEGMNKRPLDSLSQLSERDRARRKNHLYRKRGTFRTEMRRGFEEMRFAQ